MEKDKLQLELDMLLANRLLTDFLAGQKCIDWAISLMQRGYECESLYILAGLDSNDWRSIEDYFGKLAEDLELTLDRKDEDLFMLLTSDIAKQVIDAAIKPQNGLSMMENTRIQLFDTDLPVDRLYTFMYLEEDISQLGDYQLFYTGLTKENIDEVIIDEMKIFLIAQSKELGDISSLIYCDECKSFTHFQYKKKRWIFKKEGWYCDKCNLSSYLAWNNVPDRKRILEILEN